MRPPGVDGENSALQVRHVGPDDRNELLRLRLAFWPDSTADELDELLARLAAGNDICVLVVDVGSGRLAGFAEVGVRPFAEGCSSSPVAYLEGIFVDEAHRRIGMARALVAVAKAWARERGFLELASDSDVANRDSRAFHRAAGFTEVGQTVNFAADTKSTRVDDREP